MSKVFGKIGRSKVALSVKMNVIEIMGQAVADKDMFCVHWSMKGLRGTENTGDTENVRAAISDGVSYAVARFNDIFTGEVHPKARKDNSGYDPMEFEMRIVSPALHKKDEKLIGKAIVNIFEKVPVLAAGQPAYEAEQTMPLTKEGTAVAHIKLTLSVKGEGAEEPEPAAETAPETSSPPPEPAVGIVIKTPPSTPQKDSGSEKATSGTSDAKEETESKKSRHRKRHSSNSASMYAAQLKRKEEELKQKDEELEKKNEEIEKLKAANADVADLREHNAFLESRVKELEQANEKTDVVPLDPMQQKMQDDLARLQDDKERLEDEKQKLSDELDEAKKEISELRKSGDSEQKKELDMLNQQLAALQEELVKAKKEISNPEGGAAAAGGSGIIMQAVIAAIGAILGVIIGRFI